MTSVALVQRPGAVLKPTGDQYTWLEILQDLDNGQREAMMRAGTKPRFEDLLGWEFGGGNAVPIFRLIGIRKFVKGFYEGIARTRQGPAPFIQGYNIDVRGNPDAGPHQMKPSNEKPKRWGFYRVHEVVKRAPDSLYPNALLLDYGLGANGPFGPPLRDYVVQIYPNNPDLLLGKAYLNILGFRIPANFFVLKRLRRHDYVG